MKMMRMMDKGIMIALPTIALVLLSGCATVKPPEPKPRVEVSGSDVEKTNTEVAIPVKKPSSAAKIKAPEPMPKVDVPASEPEKANVEDVAAELVKFGHLRTLIRSNEEVTDQNGVSRKVEEILPELEKDLAERDFRIFSSEVTPAGDIATLSRVTRAQLIIDVNAKSEFVNSTGQFSKYRAEGEIRAIRGRDGTVLAVVRSEQIGPRHQDDERAGLLALREITPALTGELISKLIEKQNQLLWAGLIINHIESAAQAQSILHQLEASAFVDYVELLSWNDVTRVASYEIIYGLRHDSDLMTELGKIKGMTIRPVTYEPVNMPAFEELLRQYK